MFKVSKNTFSKSLQITKPILYPHQYSMQYFDNAGYELNDLEKAYYSENNIPINYHLRHICNQLDWIIQTKRKKIGPYIEHSMILQRYEYIDEAKEQIEEHSIYKPIAKKLLSIIPKWGVDFNLDFIGENYAFELFHIEIDKHSLDEILEIKNKIEHLVLNTDWFDAAKKLLTIKDKWAKLNLDDQSDFKARYFGFERAFDNLSALTI